MKVLLAEDEREIRDLVSLGLRLNGIDVHSVNDGKAAVEAAGQQQFDMILLDMNMPHLNGDLAASQIRDLPAYQRIPILFLSGDDDAANLGLPFSDSLAKPFTIRELAERVHLLRESAPEERQP